MKGKIGIKPKKFILYSSLWAKFDPQGYFVWLSVDSLLKNWENLDF